jgi:signal transduction histidine kinase
MIIIVSTPLRDRILIVESDPLVADLVSRQALQAAGYQTYVVNDAALAINQVMRLNPDMIIANLNLPGLSGKDLMVALTSQGMDMPVVALAKKGQESDVIQAFRLGAIDILVWPFREPEVITVVERAMRAVREQKERARLARQLQQTNQELQSRVRELTTIFAIGKAVISITDQSLLFERILEGALRVSQADLGWLLLRTESQKTFHLAAQRGLPASLMAQLQQPWDDGISSLVAMSGEALTITGEPLKRSKISGIGQSALIAPVKVQKQVIGLLVVMRKQANAFTPSEQNLLEAVADYASISLVNSRLFRTVEERARSLEEMAGYAQTGERINREILYKAKRELRGPLLGALNCVDKLARDPTARWNPDQRVTLSSLNDQLQNLSRITEGILPPEEQPDTARLVNMGDLVQQATNRFQNFARQANLNLVCETPSEAVQATADAGHIAQVLDGLLSNAIKFSPPGGQVTMRLESTPERQAHITVSDAGVGLDANQVAHLFDAERQPSPDSRPLRFGGLGIGLALVKEIITHQKGKIWVESRMGQGTRIHFTLPTG